MKQFDNYKTGYLHTLKDSQFQSDLKEKLQNIRDNEKIFARRDRSSIDSPNFGVEHGSSGSISDIKNTLNFKARKYRRN
jgi:hypothetical protein